MFPIKTKAGLLNLWHYPDNTPPLQLKCVTVSFSRTLAYKLNVAEIILTSVGGISHAGTRRIQRKYSSAVLSFSRAVITAGTSHTGGFQRE